MDIYYIDGKFVPADQAVLPVNDLAVLRGYGVFDFLRTYGGKPFHLEAHIQRLERSARTIGLPLPLPPDQISDVVMQTLERNSHPESNIRIVVTGGGSDDFITPQDRPRLLVMVTRLHELPAWWYTEGVKIITVPMERFAPTSKSINYIPAIMALQEAQRQNAVEAIYRDRQQCVLEGTTVNLFAFIDDVLVTPGRDILPGITRQTIMDLTSDAYPVKIRDISLDEIPRAAEVFITASNKEVVPVIQVDEIPIADAQPGERTRQIMRRFEDYTAQYGRTGHDK